LLIVLKNIAWILRRPVATSKASYCSAAKLCESGIILIGQKRGGWMLAWEWGHHDRPKTR
jgi:hypothetical protein